MLKASLAIEGYMPGPSIVACLSLSCCFRGRLSPVLEVWAFCTNRHFACRHVGPRYLVSGWFSLSSLNVACNSAHIPAPVRRTNIFIGCKLHRAQGSLRIVMHASFTRSSIEVGNLEYLCWPFCRGVEEVDVPEVLLSKAKDGKTG